MEIFWKIIAMLEETFNNFTGNPAVLKRINTTRILHQLRFSGPASRADLARRTGLDAKTLTNVSNRLFEEGLIFSHQSRPMGRGRPAEIISINPDAAYSVGVDLGCQQVTGVLMDLAGKVLAHYRQEFGVPCDKKVLLKKAEDIVMRLLAPLDRSAVKRVKGIGFCIPGFLDRDLGLAVESVNIRGMKNIPVNEIFENRFGQPVILEEASRTLALAELWFGDQHSSKHFIAVDLGVGIGMGIIHNGVLYRGAREKSGEIGHTVVEPEGIECSCGKRGCLETVASGRGLANLANGLAMKKGHSKSTGAKAIYDAAIAGDPQSRALLAQAGEYIGRAIANVMNLFDPDHVILNGGLIHAGDLIVEPLKEAIRTHYMGSVDQTCRIEISRLGDLAGAMGAAMLPLKSYFEYENIRF